MEIKNSRTRFDEKHKLLAKKYKKSKNSNLDEDDKSLLKIAEKIKKLLSSKDKVSEIVDGPKGPLKIDISRNEFENIIDTFLEKIKMLMEEALDRAKCKPSNINQTLLVGGSTRIPIVTEIKKSYPKLISLLVVIKNQG